MTCSSYLALGQLSLVSLGFAYSKSKNSVLEDCPSLLNTLRALCPGLSFLMQAAPPDRKFGS